MPPEWLKDAVRPARETLVKQERGRRRGGSQEGWPQLHNRKHVLRLGFLVYVATQEPGIWEACLSTLGQEEDIRAIKTSEETLSEESMESNGCK
jgi:hypothetical protein